jgi:hypothetical protein
VTPSGVCCRLCCALALATPVISDLDIWRAAVLLIKQRGADAEIVASRWAYELMEREDYEGRAVWIRIMNAVAELLAQPSGPVH